MKVVKDSIYFSLDMFDLKVAPADEFQMKTRSVSIGSPFTGKQI